MSTQASSALTDSVVRELSSRLDEPDWLLETRLEALEALDDLPFPDVIQTPGRRWTNLEALDFEALVDPLAQGEAKERDVPDGVSVLSWPEALADHEDLVRDHFGTIIDPLENRLVALSTALFSTGTVIHVPADVDAEAVTVRTTMDGRSLFNYTLVVTDESSSVTILERQASEGDLGGHRYYSGLVELVAGENASVQYGALQDLDEVTYNYTLKRARADTYATANWIEGNLGSRLTKTSVGTELVGDGSETKIIGAFFGRDDQHFDLDSRVWHEGEHTTADLVTRGVIDDRARSVYEGTQVVGRDAWGTSSYQRENTLMLSEEAEADASPKLIINNHDTEASHSASVGQIDREDLLYLMTRGIGERAAKNMLVEGFFVPVLDEIAVEEFREDLREGISTRLHSRR